jgi:Ca-activated chloride channel family protein
MVPGADKRERDIFPRELVFVIDNSGSMMGFPIEKCKAVIRLSLENMRKDDLFNVMKFSGWTGMLWPESKKATEDNVKAGLGYIDQMEGGGGTEMLAAINALFDMPRAEGRRRLVLFLTDGYVGNDGAILSAVRQRLGESRVFSLGVGSSVNRYLMEGLAYAGKGACLIIRQDGDAQKTMEDFFEFIDAPALTDITLRWNGVEAMEPQPADLPDLFFGQPLVVTAKYKKAGRGTLVIRGKLAREKSYETSMDIDLPEEENSRGVLATLWARKKIKEIGKRVVRRKRVHAGTGQGGHHPARPCLQNHDQIYQFRGGGLRDPEQGREMGHDGAAGGDA